MTVEIFTIIDYSTFNKLAAYLRINKTLLFLLYNWLIHKMAIFIWGSLD